MRLITTCISFIVIASVPIHSSAKGIARIDEHYANPKVAATGASEKEEVAATGASEKENADSTFKKNRKTFLEALLHKNSINSFRFERPPT